MRQIKTSVDNGEFAISPFSPENLKEASYTFILDSRIKRLKGSPDLRGEAQYSEEIMDEEGIVLESGAFVVGYTKEKLSLNGKYACMLSVRSSVATRGLAALLTDTFCEPDTDNQIALPIQNVSGFPLKIYPGMKIVKGVFFKL